MKILKMIKSGKKRKKMRESEKGKKCLTAGVKWLLLGKKGKKEVLGR